MLQRGNKTYGKALGAAEGKGKIKVQFKVFGLRKWKLPVT